VLALQTNAGDEFRVRHETAGAGGQLPIGFPCAISVSQDDAVWGVFDIAQHGYDAIAAGFRPQAPRLSHEWRCEACGADKARVTVALMYNSWDEPDFHEPGIAPEDCFDWITVGLTCANCGLASDGFFDHECA